MLLGKARRLPALRLQRWLRTAALALVTAAPIMQLSSSTPAAATVPFSEYNVHIAATEPDDEGRPVTLDGPASSERARSKKGQECPGTNWICPTRSTRACSVLLRS